MVVIASAALFVVLAGFSGLKSFGLLYSNSFDPDIKIMPLQGKTFIASEESLQKISRLKGVVSYSKVVQERVLLSYKQKTAIAYLKGVDTSFIKVVPIDKSIPYGRWIAQNSSQVLFGFGVANQLGIGILEYGEPVKAMIPKLKQNNSFIQKPFKSKLVAPVGVFSVNQETDNNYIISDIALATDLLNFSPHQVSFLEVKLAPDTAVEKLKSEIASIFNNNAVVKDREQQNQAIYKMLNTENMAIYMIFTLVLIIALFNVVGAIIMMILDKKSNLKTLHALGASNIILRRLFFNVGMLLSSIGGFVGVGLGLLVVFLQKSLGFAMITPSIPYPMEITFENSITVILTILVLGFIASKIAAARISKKLISYQT